MQRIRLGWLVGVLSITSTAAHAVDGDLDAAWGNSGRLAIDITPGSDFAQRLLIQPDGKLLIAGYCNGGLFCATRLLANGSYDVAFGSDNTQPGRVVLTENPIALADATLIANGESVFAGMESTSSAVIVSTFPNQGITNVVTTALSNYGQIPASYILQAIAGQADGKIVIAGSVPQTPGSAKLAITRFNADFGLDANFGDNGTKLLAFAGGGIASASAIAIQPNGKIVIAGTNNQDIGVVRLLANGQLDDDPVLGFGDGGKATFNWGLLTRVNAVKIDRDGGVLIAGTVYGATGPVSSDDIFVGRLTPRGVFDLSFGALCPPPACAGPVYIDRANQDDACWALAVLSDGSILVSGSGSDASHRFFTVNRLTRFGDPDTSFGSFGQIQGYYIPAGTANSANAIAIGNGGIMIAGESFDPGGSNFRFGIAKLKLDLIFRDSLD